MKSGIELREMDGPQLRPPSSACVGRLNRGWACAIGLWLHYSYDTNPSIECHITGPTQMSDNAAPLSPATEHVTMPLPNATASHVLLLATVNNLSTPCFLSPAIASATRCVRDRLVIVLFSRLFNTGRRPRSPLSGHNEKVGRRRSFDSSHSNNSSVGVSHTECWDDVQRLLTYVYVQATAVAQKLDKVLLKADVLLRGFDEDLSEDFGKDFEVVIRIEGGGSSRFES